MGSHEPGDSGDLGTERYVRVVVEAEADPYGNLRAPRWSTARLLPEGEEVEPGPHDMVVSVPAERASELTSSPRPWDAPGTYATYDEWRAREEAKRRHPAGRALTGIFSQSHPWLSPPEPAVSVERPVLAVGRVEALEARVAELEARLAVVEGRDVIEVSTLASEEPRVVEL